MKKINRKIPHVKIQFDIRKRKWQKETEITKLKNKRNELINDISD